MRAGNCVPGRFDAAKIYSPGKGNDKIFSRAKYIIDNRGNMTLIKKNDMIVAFEARTYCEHLEGETDAEDFGSVIGGVAFNFAWLR